MGNILKRRKKKKEKENKTNEAFMKAENQQKHIHENGEGSEPEVRMAKAVYDFVASGDTEVNMQKGDRLQVAQCSADSSVDGWIGVVNVRTNEKGFVPLAYITKDNQDDADDDKSANQVGDNQSREHVTDNETTARVQHDHAHENHVTVDLTPADKTPAKNSKRSQSNVVEKNRGAKRLQIQDDTAKRSRSNVENLHSQLKDRLQPAKLKDEVESNSIKPMPQTLTTKSGGSTINLEERVMKRAAYDFTARTGDELSFRKDDRLLVLGENSDTKWQSWLFVRNLRSLEEGYVPINYVVVDEDVPEAQDWFFNLERREANKQLLYPGQSTGTFLVRNARDKKTYALSIRVKNADTDRDDIKHYRIKIAGNGHVFINEKKKFPTLIQLVRHHQVEADGLVMPLMHVCPKVKPTVPFTQLEVKHDSITLINELGAGCFGKVYKGKWQNVLDVAVKTLKPGAMTSEDFLAEAETMHRMQHRHLVLLLAVCTTEEPFYMITELMMNGALKDYLMKEDARRTISYKAVLDMGAQIACGMSYLEENNYIHRDLRAANILVGDNVIKIADFGLARLTNKNKDADGLQGFKPMQREKFPVRWTAPEAIHKQRFTIKSDIWSFGIVLYEIVTFGATPYPGMTNQQVIKAVDSGYRMPRPRFQDEALSDECYNQMLDCWQKSPIDRPTFDFLHSCFENLHSEEDKHTY